MNNTQKQVMNLEILIRSYYTLIYVVSPEERRVMEAASQISQRLGWNVYHWSCLAGLAAYNPASYWNPAEDAPIDPDTLDPAAALQAAALHKEPALFIFKDFHPYLTTDNLAIIRSLREAAQKFPGCNKAVIMTGSILDLPPDLVKEVAVLDFPLPGAEEIGALLDDTARGLAGNPNFAVDLAGSAREEIIKAAQGLTLVEAKNAFTKSLVTNGRLGVEQIPEVLTEKRSIIRKSGLLEYHDPELGMDDIGGLESLKNWLAKRKEAFSDRAARFGLPSPRGVLILGIQGCGKSICAKAVSSLWNLPLLRLDFGRIFDSQAGGSEGNIRRAIEIAEAISPCILWIDEIDKTFGGQNQASDGGSSKRVLGTFLTWLGEKKSPVFVAATANNVASMPPELLRKGRFDEIFFVDIPNEQERQNILAIHLARRGRNPADFDLSGLAKSMEGFNGAEIEQAVIAGLFSAFDEDSRELSNRDITIAITETVPLSTIMREEVEALRRWCHARARSASEVTRTVMSSRLVRSSGKL